ncbi:TetR family transcriptional regulator [Salmonella enterica subsp. enterica serovar Choleraesuis]|nr:TetR family transcriptional regulator [Salmonella enterica subsp. enterica serovar Choleraesuis]
MNENLTFVSPKQRRTRQAILDMAMQMYSRGLEPTVAEVAGEAGVSRATAYRYFPTQGALVTAMVEQSLGPLMHWQSDEPMVDARIRSLFGHAWPRLFTYEGVLRSALKVSLDQWARTTEGTLHETLTRGNRIRILRRALAPLEEHLSPSSYDNLLKSLAVVYGTEALVVLKDIAGSDNNEVMRITEWMAIALLEKAQRESQSGL